MIFNSKKNRIIGSYLCKLPNLMTVDYGNSLEYTPMQVIKSIERYKFNAKYQDYALVLYCRKEDFLNHFENDESEKLYLKLKQELADKYFDGSEFNGTDVSKYSKIFRSGSYKDDTEYEFFLLPDGGGDGGGD